MTEAVEPVTMSAQDAEPVEPMTTAPEPHPDTDDLSLDQRRAAVQERLDGLHRERGAALAMSAFKP